MMNELIDDTERKIAKVKKTALPFEHHGMVVKPGRDKIDRESSRLHM